MRYILIFLCLTSIAYGQSTVYLRADSIKIMKQNGNANLQILNATRDSTNGLLLNIGNGITKFQRIRAIAASQFTVGTDTITISGAGSSLTAASGVRLNGSVITLSNASTGNVLTDDVYWDGHTNGRTFDILSTQTRFDAKQYVLFQSNTVDTGYTEIKTKLKIYSEVYSDANATILKNYSGVTLPVITANRIATFHNAAADKRGAILYVNNKNNSAFTWTVAGATLMDADGTAITTLTNRTFYQFMWDGSAWVKMNSSGGAFALLRNPTIAGYAIFNFHSYIDTVYGKRLVPGYGLLFDSTATAITPRVDTATLGLIVRGYGWQIGGNTLAADGRLGTNSNHDIHIYTNNTKRAEITNGGQFLWNASSSPLAYNFYVADTSHFTAIRIASSAMSGSGSNALFGIKTATASASDYNVLITDNANIQLFRISNAGDITGAFGSLTSTLFSISGATATLRASNAATTTGTFLELKHFNPSTHTSGNAAVIQTSGNFTASSGTGTLTSLLVQPIIAQTGSASGKSWGLKIRPSLTSGAEFIHLELTTNTTNWPTYYVQQNMVATTNATPTTLHTFSTVGVATDISSTYLIKCEIIGNRTGGASGAAGDNAVYIYEGAFERINGVVTLMTESLRLVSENQAGWNVTSNISGTTIQILVTGATNNNISWHMAKGEVSHGGE